ncbi:predicted protein [Lichtheimia corymbifera JMRC:FSU:9682]|uniref:Uncharacterized protein n=1 Tax=Lichtheimia corymbifera JMRC:FSU:9682 TaxID=1263082 RepID=A0A068SEF9_9FUNG|nr:predicted protein [Lichtheimia corymbifera JMRC:FSU:9682]
MLTTQRLLPSYYSLIADTSGALAFHCYPTLIVIIFAVVSGSFIKPSLEKHQQHDHGIWRGYSQALIFKSLASLLLKLSDQPIASTVSISEAELWSSYHDASLFRLVASRIRRTVVQTQSPFYLRNKPSRLWDMRISLYMLWITLSLERSNGIHILRKFRSTTARTRNGKSRPNFTMVSLAVLQGVDNEHSWSLPNLPYS